MATLRQNSQFESPGILRRMNSMYQDGQPSTPATLRRMKSMFQEGQPSTPSTLRRMGSMYQDGQFEKVSSPRLLRKTASMYQDGQYEVPRSPRMLTKMASVFQEAQSPAARLRRMTTIHSEGHFEAAPAPRMGSRPMPMPTSLFPDDLLAPNLSPRMTRSPLPRMGSFYDNSQFEGGGSLTPKTPKRPSNGLHHRQESAKPSPIPPRKMTSMFEVARSMEKIKSIETNNLSPEIKVIHQASQTLAILIPK